MKQETLNESLARLRREKKSAFDPSRERTPDPKDGTPNADDNLDGNIGGHVEGQNCELADGKAPGKPVGNADSGVQGSPLGAGDAGSASQAPASKASALPAWVQAKLTRKLSTEGSRRGQSQGAGRVAEPRSGPTRQGGDASDSKALSGAMPLAPVTVGDPKGLADTQTELGPVCARTTEYAMHSVHGCFELGEVAHSAADVFALLAADPSLAAVDPLKAIYLDIETTGLAGGAGTLSFMVGLGTFVAGRFDLWQGFLRGPEGERALLAEVAQRIRDAQCVVSFFGKSFDRHRLEDKMRLHRIVPPFADRPHLDLYHPLQRLYGGVWRDGRLGTMERELCAVERVDDLPGSYAPAAWFDYLARREHRLEAVFRHNRDDVLSLVVLAAHLGAARRNERACGVSLAGPQRARAAGLAKSLAQAGRYAEALECSHLALSPQSSPQPAQQASTQGVQADAAANSGLPATRHWRARELHASLLGRSGSWRTAHGAWVELSQALSSVSGGGALAVRALIEAAKLLEHRLGEPQSAMELCRQARQRAGAELGMRARARILADLDRREARLAARLDSGHSQAQS